MTTETIPLAPSALSQLNAALKRRLGPTVPPTPKEIVDALDDAGIRLTAEGDNLRIVKGKLTPEQRQLVKDHKPAIHDYLTGFGMKFDFWVPAEADAIITLMHIRLDHHQWPDDDESKRLYFHIANEMDAAYLERNVERLKRAESRLHDWLDRQPFAMKGPSKDGYDQVSWYYEPCQGIGLDGLVKLPKSKMWRKVAAGVFNEDRPQLEGYLAEFVERIPGCEVKVQESGVEVKRPR